MAGYIDIGVNLTGSSFRQDCEQVIERALAAGVERLIVTGTNVEHSARALQLSEQYAGICYATVGLHPHHASEYSHDTGSELADMLQHDNAVAAGECGLDFNRNFSTREQQIRAFEAQLELAIDMQKPVFLHQRDAHADYLAMLTACRAQLGKAVAHCFTGSVQEANDYLALDMHIGITGWICDQRRGQALQQAVSHIPLDRIMLETDAPYLLPRDLAQTPVVKNRNEPCFLPHIARRTAECMNIGEEELVEAAYGNSLAFFGLD